MHTLMVMGAGFVLLGLCLLAGKLTGGMRAAMLVFVVLWFLGALGNLWVGVAQAGYSVRDELPVFVVVFALPAAVALLLCRRFRSN
ncbi:MAG: hypothetical protein WC205_01620 [Opitutaceae bacterium]|jgi:apolipoprotein N-acyltransferase